MITVNVLYKNSASIKFNMNYYLDTHIPLVSRLLGATLKGVLVQHGSGGGARVRRRIRGHHGAAL